MLESKQEDQAATLRREFSKGGRVRDVTRVISFTSGKGGVGKTTTVVNMGLALSQLGRNVLLLDADLGLANIDVLLGLQPKYTIHDVLRGEKGLEEVVVNGPGGVSIIPAASGIESMCSLTTQQQMALMSAIEHVADHYDYLLIDTRGGIGSDVMYFNSAASEVVVVINPEPTSLTDAYALIKLLATGYGEKSFSIIANNVLSEKDGQRAFKMLARAVDQFLHVSLTYCGHIPSDLMVRESIRAQRALLELHPSSPAGAAFRGIARTLDSEPPRIQLKGGMQFFFKQLLEMSSYGG